MMEQTDLTPATPATPQPAPAAPATAPRTAVEIASMLANGSIDSREAGRLAGAANVPLLDVARSHATIKNAAAAPPPAPDTRTPEQKTLDQHFPPGKEADYVINYGVPDGQEMSPEHKQFDQSARSWLSGAEFPKDLGNSVVHAIDNVLQHTAKMNAAQLEKYGEDEFQKLEHVYKDKLGEKLQMAGRMVAELEKVRPGLKRLLQSSGIGDNSMVASLIIQQAERYFARRTP